MPHLLRHGPIVYNGHLRGPMTLTPVAERLAVELSRQGIEYRSPACEANVLPLRHRGGASYVKFNKLNQNKYIHTFVFIFLLMLLFLMKTISNISDTRIRRENDAVSENNA